MKFAVPVPADERPCPQCGTEIARTARRCAHCRAALCAAACPRCDARVLERDTRCRACSKQLVGPSAPARTSGRTCPRCSSALHTRQVDDILFDECTGCGGVFLDHVAIQRVIGERAQRRAEALLETLPRRELRAVPAAGDKMYLPCPVCHIIMNRRLFAVGTGVIIDVCRVHGTFLDAGELPRVIELVMRGGLVRTSRHDVPRAQDPAPQDRLPANAAALPVARIHQDRSLYSTAADALVDLLAFLFDHRSHR